MHELCVDCTKSIVEHLKWMSKGHKSLAHHKKVKDTVKYFRHAPDTAAVLAVL